MRRALVIVMALLLGAGCSGQRDVRSLLGPDGAGTIVVDGRLFVGHVFPDIRLTVTQAPDQPFATHGVPLLNAGVFLTTGTADTVWYGRGYGDGTYEASNGTVPDLVLPRTTYRLHVTAADGRVVGAATTTPDTFSVREWLLVDSDTFSVRRALTGSPYDTLFYQDGLVEARFDRGNALAFQMAIFNLEQNSPLLLSADFIDPADLATLERQSSSPPLDAPDGYVRLPWLAVWYEGRHQFNVYSVDRNWYDVARSVRFNGPANLGFGSNSGDDFERPLFHVEGGIGLFGSAAVDDINFTVVPRP